MIKVGLEECRCLGQAFNDTLVLRDADRRICDACLFLYAWKDFKALSVRFLWAPLWLYWWSKQGYGLSTVPWLCMPLICWLLRRCYMAQFWSMPTSILADRLAHEIWLVPSRHGEWSHYPGDEKSTVWSWAELSMPLAVRRRSESGCVWRFVLDFWLFGWFFGGVFFLVVLFQGGFFECASDIASEVGSWIRLLFIHACDKGWYLQCCTTK